MGPATIWPWQLKWLDHSAKIQRLGFESPIGRDLFCLKFFDTFTRTSVQESTMNAIFCAQATFLMLTLLQIYLSMPSLQTQVITMTSSWARWRLKSIASRLFTHPFIQGADERKHKSSASLAFVRVIHRWLVNYPHKRPITRKVSPFDDVIIWVITLHWKTLNRLFVEDIIWIYITWDAYMGYHTSWKFALCIYLDNTYLKFWNLFNI